MRDLPARSFVSCLPAALVAAGLVLAVPGGAAPLQGSTLTVIVPYIDFEFNALPPASFVASGPSGMATSNLLATLASGTAFAGLSVLPSGPEHSAISVSILSNTRGTFSAPAPQSVRGVAAFPGSFRFKRGGGTLFSVPFVLGAPQTQFLTAPGFAVTAAGGSWTAGTAAVTGVPFFYSVYIPAVGSVEKMGFTTLTRMGSNGLTPGGQGTLVLVAPVAIQSTLAIIPNSFMFGTLSLSFVPEPGTLLLHGWAVLMLAVYGWRNGRG